MAASSARGSGGDSVSKASVSVSCRRSQSHHQKRRQDRPPYPYQKDVPNPETLACQFLSSGCPEQENGCLEFHMPEPPRELTSHELG
ncbi:hypothetical protein C1H46_045849 [Malus baccata]|uniref:Uncharacterized protein n=1 Tax=Malus baccata TaxID=106549 RepID=A0A540K2X7_MALBA|nr:hypothetical protein C1H46_045849 [Malus baccata]